VRNIKIHLDPRRVENRLDYYVLTDKKTICVGKYRCFLGDVKACFVSDERTADMNRNNQISPKIYPKISIKSIE